MAAGLRLAALLFAALAAASPDTGFAVRIVKISGPPDAASTREHLQFCRELGFNALWVESSEAGAWTKDEAPEGPRLTPEFLRLARWCKRRDIDLWVAIRPVADSAGRFVFTDPERQRRVLAFASKLREQAGVRRLVLALDDAPAELRELSDIFTLGASSAPAHLTLARRLADALPGDAALWLLAPAHCDAQLGDGNGPYAKPFLAGLPSLPARVGLVWSGPRVLSPSITGADLSATRARLGGRPLVLEDSFPTDDDNVEDDAMALLLAALRGRDPAIREAVSGYVACPPRPLAGSRFTLLTIASFLKDPAAYDPGAATKAAIARLAGRDPAAASALETQQLEWGGALAGRNYWPRSLLNPALAAGRLHDPAFVDSFTWTAERYPGRMKALARLADAPFRGELLRMMRRRLAIARAMPLTVDYLARVRAGDPEAVALLLRIEDERRSWRDDPDARSALDGFLSAAAVPVAASAR